MQLCGDAHLSNFGAFAAPDRRLVFSINDFDETLPGPFEWDVKRLVASFAVAGRDRGFDASHAGVDQPDGGAGLPGGDPEVRGDGEPRRLVRPHRHRRLIEQRRLKQAQPKAGEALRANVAKARSKDSLKAFGKLTEIVDGEPRIVSRPAADRPDRGDRRARTSTRSSSTSSSGADPLLPAHPDRRPPPAARALPLRARGTQGRRRRQRRHPRLDHAAARPRRQRSAVPAVQGGRGVGARAVPRQERVRQPRPAGRRGPAADAGRERHHARLDPGREPARRRQARLLRAPAVGRQGLGAGRGDGTRR